MATTTAKSVYWKGWRDGAPFIVALVPFATLFGVVATEAGLSVFQTLMFSVTVIAGSAQFTALQMMAEEAPTIIVVASALAVNLRMAMYSASLTPHLGHLPAWQRAIAAYFTVDQSFAISMVKFEEEPDMPPSHKLPYFLGVVSPVFPMWYLFTLVGALVGQAIPGGIALDFAVPIMFIALVGPMLRTPAHIAAAFTSVVLALLLVDVPFNLGLIIAGLSAILVGARVELVMSRRAEA